MSDLPAEQIEKQWLKDFGENATFLERCNEHLSLEFCAWLTDLEAMHSDVEIVKRFVEWVRHNTDCMIRVKRGKRNVSYAEARELAKIE